MRGSPRNPGFGTAPRVKKFNLQTGQGRLADVTVQRLRGWVGLTSPPIVKRIGYLSNHNASSDGVLFLKTGSINTPEDGLQGPAQATF